MGKRIKGDIWTLAQFISRKVKKLTEYKDLFQMLIKTEQIKLARELVKFMKADFPSNRVDTGTMRKRIDSKVEDWDRVVFGIFEPNSEFYNSSKHKPTGNISKYTGKVIPEGKSYAKYPYKTMSPFIKSIVERMYFKELSKRVRKINKKYLFY